MYYTYAIKSKINSKLYYGHTQNLEERLKRHNSDKGKYTSKSGSWVLVYFEEFMTRSLAVQREIFFKSGKGREFIKLKISNDKINVGV